MIESSPWNELQCYYEGQHLYGRDEEVRVISQSIYVNLHTILYGQSGIGKSSLLLAGIFPVLRKKSFFPVYIRLKLVSIEDSYVDYIIYRIEYEARENNLYLYKNEDYDIRYLNDVEKLSAFIHNTEFKNTESEKVSPVLVFDQFEEILKNKDTFQKTCSLLFNLYSILYLTKREIGHLHIAEKLRIVFSLREDYLYCLQEIVNQCNLKEFQFNRFRINALSHQQTREIILKTSNGAIEKEKVEEICDKIIEKSQNNIGEISTLLFSLICSSCYLNSIDGILKLKIIEDYNPQLLSYYESKMRVVHAKAKQYLEHILVSEDGRREFIAVGTAIDSGKVSPKEIDALVNSRIIRRFVTADFNENIEFIHDEIASMIFNKKPTYMQRIKATIAKIKTT